MTIQKLKLIATNFQSNFIILDFFTNYLWISGKLNSVGWLITNSTNLLSNSTVPKYTHSTALSIFEQDWVSEREITLWWRCAAQYEIQCENNT